MGDDTWVNLYPSDFYSAFPFDSFNVKDLHTVDNGVMHHMFDEFAKGDDWSFIIGHMLGVDHVGHRYYSNHPLMATKLGQVNKFIADLIDAMPEDTVLFVMGDHGMTDDGNHGGASRKETGSVIFVHSNKQFPDVGATSSRQVFQIDLVPTLSLLLGIPIPFNNLGTVMPEMLFDATTIPDAFYLNAL
jgi:phosphatidylinositol glycan class O